MKIDGKNIIVILLAGGIGSRLGSSKSKQMLKVGNVTMLENCIDNFINNVEDIKIIIVSNYSDLIKTQNISEKYGLLSPVIGGKNRHESVYQGLKSIKEHSPKFVLVHDSARPIVTKEMLKKLICHRTKKYSCVIPVIPINDSIRIIFNKKAKKVIEKQDKVLVQTPQFCNYEDLLYAHQTSIQPFEDESSLFMNQGKEVATIEGDSRSLKITYQNDLKLIEPYILNNNFSYITKIGNGFDIHRFNLEKIQGRNYILLGGIKIPNTRQLIGHSDADVLLHAITDSILGVVNKGDIGKLFPPSDKKWKNCDSSIFLKHASELLYEQNGKINNIDAVVICEKPKILDYSQLIQENIAEILGINPKRISIKGKTSESLGFIGREEGIAVMVNTSIKIIDNISDD